MNADESDFCLCGLLERMSKKRFWQNIYPKGNLGVWRSQKKTTVAIFSLLKSPPTETDEGYRLNGEKWIINNATRGATMSILARLHSQTGREKLACFFVEKSKLAPGEFRNIDKVKTHARYSRR